MSARPRLLQVLVSPWVLTAVAIQLFGWWLVANRAPINPFEPGAYALSLLAGVALWLLLALLRDSLGGIWRWLVVLLASLLVVSIGFASYFVYEEFGEFVSASMLNFLWSSGGAGEFWTYFSEYVFTPRGLYFALGVVVVGSVWGLGASTPVRPGRPRRIAALAAGTTLILSLVGCALIAPRTRLSPDAAVLVAASRAPLMDWGERWRRGERIDIPPVEPADQRQPNVVVIIIESWHPRAAPPFEAGGQVMMPFLDAWMRRESDQFFAFERAYSSTTSTTLALPSLITGLGPYQSVEDYHRVPLLWDWARAAGAEPLVVSGKTFSSHNFDEFMDLTDLAHFRAGQRTPQNPHAQEGADEVEAAIHFGRLVDELDDEQPFMGFYASYSMHMPFYTDSPHLEREPPFDSAYANAAFVVDAVIERIIEGLRDSGELDETLVILTGDHGSAQFRRHLPPRAYSLYEEYTNIPLLIRVPASWRRHHPQRVERLRINRQRLVSQLDVVPTLVNLWSFADSERHRDMVGALSGESLFEPIAEDRTLILLNNNDIRRWEHEAFGIFWGQMRFLFSDIEGPRLYDIAEDPTQRHNLWPPRDHAIRRRIESTIESTPHLDRIWQTYR